MLAHYHGQVWNSADVARSCGVSDKTVRHHASGWDMMIGLVHHAAGE
jgi:hypothetical protein